MTTPDNPTPTRGVLVTLDRPRHIRYTLRALREIRTEFGEDALTRGVSADSVAKLLWFGLRHEDPDLTIEQVEEMVDLENLDEVMRAVGVATSGRVTTTVGETVPPGPLVPVAPSIPSAQQPATTGGESTGS